MGNDFISQRAGGSGRGIGRDGPPQWEGVEETWCRHLAIADGRIVEARNATCGSEDRIFDLECRGGHARGARRPTWASSNLMHDHPRKSLQEIPIQGAA